MGQASSHFAARLRSCAKEYDVTGDVGDGALWFALSIPTCSTMLAHGAGRIDCTRLGWRKTKMSLRDSA